MGENQRQQLKQNLKTLGESLFKNLQADEHLTLSYSGEESLFMRINQAKVRQASDITQAYLSLDFISGRRRTECAFSLTGDLHQDLAQALNILERCRTECRALSEDPFIVFPEEGESSDEDHYGHLAPHDKISDLLLKPASSCDLAGLFTSGTLMRATMNSKGQFHWFSTDNFYFDYSLYTSSQKAIKSIYAGSHWEDAVYLNNLRQAQDQLKILEKTPRTLAPAKYRVYFAPSAVGDLLEALAWSGLSARALKEGASPLKKLFEGERTLSPHFSLDENFQQGLVPRFNELGEISVAKLPLITQGKLTSPLINRRTAQEYTLTSNAANAGEQLRSAAMHPGTLPESKILSTLETGIYVSNLHYLNWSDLQHGRITGMTRYGCFWVEKGEIVSPIQDMRFDETVYNFFGDTLEAVGDKAHIIPLVWSYHERHLGGYSVPGILVNDFPFIL